MKRTLLVILFGLQTSGCGVVKFTGQQSAPSAPIAPIKTIPKTEANTEVEPVPTPACLLNAKGTVVTSVSVSGENCVGNQIDPNGADRDDYAVTIRGSLIRDGWDFFADKDQELQIEYSLGSPGTTTQSVAMQIVDCQGVKQTDFAVTTGSGNGSRTLKARRGDRFNILATVTSGCYDTRPVYDMLKDKDRAFQIR
jgi:hypothetical protein